MTLATVYKQATPSFTVRDFKGAYDPVNLTEPYIQMLDIFGLNLLSYMLGTEEHSGPNDDASVTDSTRLRYPYNSLRDRLRTLYEASQMILSIDSIHILRMWIIGQNPDLDYNPPAIKIRNGELRQVLAAADSYRTGGF